MTQDLIIESFSLQDKPKAIALRDTLRADGKHAWLTMDLGTRRYGGQIHVHINRAANSSGQSATASI